MQNSEGLLLVSGRSGEQMRDLVHEKLQEYFGYKNHKDLVGHVNAKDFNNGEIFAQLKENQRGKNIHVFQSVHSPDTDELVGKIMASDLDGETKQKLVMERVLTLNKDIMELLILGDGIKRAGAKNIYAYLPHWPYSRQDKKDDGRVPVSAKLMFKLLEAAFGKHLEKFATIAVHAEQEQGFTELPLDNLPMTGIYGLYIKSHFADLSEVVIVSPDAGGDRRAQKLAKVLGIPYATIDKRRPTHGVAEASGVRGNVKGKTALLYDDMGDSLGSVVTAYDILMKEGARPEMVALLAHGICSRSMDKKTGQLRFAEDRIREKQIKVVATNSIPRTQEYYEVNRDIFPNLIDISYPLAALVHSNHAEGSWSDHIDDLEQKVAEGKFKASDVDKYVVRL